MLTAAGDGTLKLASLVVLARLDSKRDSTKTTSLHVMDKVARAEELIGHGFSTVVLRRALGPRGNHERETRRGSLRRGKGMGASRGVAWRVYKARGRLEASRRRGGVGASTARHRAAWRKKTREEVVGWAVGGSVGPKSQVRPLSLFFLFSIFCFLFCSGKNTKTFYKMPQIFMWPHKL